MAVTKIEWTAIHHADGTVTPGFTFNPWRGCTKVSAGCANCYAETLSGRNPGTLGVWGPNGTRVVASEAMWREPVKWNRDAEKIGDWFCPNCDAYLSSSRVTFEENCDTCGTAVEFHKARPRVFCASLGDVFEGWTGDIVDASATRLWTGRRHDGSGFWWVKETPQGGFSELRPLTMQDIRARLFALIDATPNLDWLLLTKRPENIAKMMPPTCDFCKGFQRLRDTHRCTCGGYKSQSPRPNVWLGVSVENQQTADERIPHLLRVPAKVRFLSCEPLLGPVDLDLRRYESDTGWFDERGRVLDWVICGGESGPGARPCNVDWIRDIVRQCRDAAVPCFVKQFGSNVVDHCDEFTPQATGWPESNGPVADWDTGDIRLRDKKGGNPSEWPADLRVREFPAMRNT